MELINEWVVVCESLTLTARGCDLNPRALSVFSHCWF